MHGHGGQLLLAKEDPYHSYDMDGHGQTRVGPAQSPDVLSKFVGSRLTDGAAIVGHDGDVACAGLMLRFDTGDLVVGTLGDEWVISVGSVPAPAAPHWAVQPFLRSSPDSGNSYAVALRRCERGDVSHRREAATIRGQIVTHAGICHKACPGMAAAVVRPAFGRIMMSSSPCTTSAGIRRAANAGRRSGEAAIAASCRRPLPGSLRGPFPVWPPRYRGNLIGITRATGEAWSPCLRRVRFLWGIFPSSRRASWGGGVSWVRPSGCWRGPDW